MIEEAVVAEPVPWILPPSPRSRRSWWKLARFIFLASACAGFIFTSAITWLVNERIEAAIGDLRKEAQRAEHAQALETRTGVLSYRNAEGFHTRGCHMDAQTRATRCAQAAK
jgi:hypothetical protein